MRVKFNGVLRVWQRNLDVYRRFFVNRLVTSTLYPILFLFSIGYGVGAYVGTIGGISYARFIAPGIVASSAMFAASFSTTYGTYIRMRFQKTFGAIISTPVSVEEVIVGEIVWGATRALFDGLIIYGVTLIFGLASMPQSLLVIPLAFLSGMVFALLGVLVSSLIKNIEQFDYYFNCFISLMFLFSGTFFPLSHLPQAFQRVSLILPLTHVVKIVRPVFLGEASPKIWIELIYLLIPIGILLPIVLVLMQRRIREYS